MSSYVTLFVVQCDDGHHLALQNNFLLLNDSCVLILVQHLKLFTQFFLILSHSAYFIELLINKRRARVKWKENDA